MKAENKEQKNVKTNANTAAKTRKPAARKTTKQTGAAAAAAKPAQAQKTAKQTAAKRTATGRTKKAGRRQGNISAQSDTGGRT